MEERATQYALLLRFYQRYLNDADTARFIASVAGHYSLGTLERLLQSGDIYSRRAAALSLGLIGDANSYSILGPLLRHHDRKLRLVVDDTMRAISGREGTAAQRQTLESIVRSNECGTFEKTIELASELIETSGASAEVYHQRSLALFQIDALEQAIEDCRQTLKLNEFHYAAMVGLGHCHLELGDLLESLFWFRRALDVYPDLEPVRLQVRRLEKAIQEL
ncbi:HEAT repeat domain-containing protein [Aureliella helgolandensis]|uniref:Tetratricopeptide repeat protein n=1 Tax=Aureliella helgolandensis TaxID=2527968 RepID=A0A518G4L9_9BACT|nr:tetratricopeptide repeat protein [Aureliella helgolandensis]QDV23538.1 Tetratricopeptide repeat protein [Aureliella helgolandensis]